MVTIGKNILENLTTGMYSDSKVAYREYIQNACDQIDVAIRQGLITSKDALVDIFIDRTKRFISIRDNATGVPSESFERDLGDIANSNKKLGENKGFRGIGRLCGLAYCKILRFTTSYQGENIASVMELDAQKMRRMLIEDKKYTIDEVLSAIIKFKTKEAGIEEHFFEVELIDINIENTDLLDVKKVIEYLSFVAPVPYKNTFILRNQIYDHAQKLNLPIDEYIIKVNGQQVFKEYTTKLKEQSGSNLKNYDEISRLEFKDFYSKSGKLLAWMWFGLSRFEKSIPKINNMRGLRIRQSNIQIGRDDTLQGLFKEPRGNYYFVGEIFAVDSGLIPNSQRDYFNENSVRVEFEDLLREYFFDVLHKLYYDANRIKNAYKRQEDYLSKVYQYEEKRKNNNFVGEEDKQKLQFEIEKAELEAKVAAKQLEKFNLDDKSPIAEVHKSIGRKFNSAELIKKIETVKVTADDTEAKNKNYITSSLSKLSRSERKLVGKIMSIITKMAPKELAEEIIKKIQEDLR